MSAGNDARSWLDVKRGESVAKKLVWADVRSWVDVKRAEKVVWVDARSCFGWV